jgi:hypothetical protein
MIDTQTYGCVRYASAPEDSVIMLKSVTMVEAPWLFTE